VNPSSLIYTMVISGQDGLPVGPVLSEARGPYSTPTSVNGLQKPPRLIYTNRGGHFKLPASVNRFCEAVFCNRLG
jgi:hypothetical protein